MFRYYSLQAEHAGCNFRLWEYSNTLHLPANLYLQPSSFTKTSPCNALLCLALFGLLLSSILLTLGVIQNLLLNQHSNDAMTVVDANETIISEVNIRITSRHETPIFNGKTTHGVGVRSFSIVSHKNRTIDTGKKGIYFAIIAFCSTFNRIERQELCKKQLKLAFCHLYV